jgi:hypothetical protein
LSGDSEDKDHEALYKTYVQPLRVPAWRAKPDPPPPEPEPAAATSPEPVPQEPPPTPESGVPKAADVPPAAAPPAPPAKDFEFRKVGEAKRGGHVRMRAVGAIVVAVGLALAYPIVHPFGSSSGSSLTQYLGRVQPLVQRAAVDRRSVQAAVSAVRSNPTSRTSAERRLVGVNRDRQALIRQLNALGTAPGVARALPARLASLLRSQIQTARVWQRWMGHHPFVYLKHDAATRSRIQALLHSQQASKGAFTRLYLQLTRAAGLSLPGGSGI